MALRLHSFRTRLALTVIALALIPLGLFGVIVATQFKVALTDQVNDSLTSDAESIEELLEDSFSYNRKNVEGWSESAAIRGALATSTFDKSDGELAALQQRYPEFLALVLFTLDGRAVSASSATLKQHFLAQPATVAATPWFKAALARRVSTAAADAVDPILGKQVLYLGAPVVAPTDGQLIGVLIGAYDFASRTASVVKAPVARAAERGYTSFELMVARSDGTPLFDSNPAVGSRMSPSEIARLIAASVGARENVAQVDDKVAVVIKGGEETGWHYLALVDRDEAYATMRHSLMLAIVLAAVFGGIATLLSLLMARRMVRPINALNVAMDRIVREGDLTREVELGTQDEVGQLAATFSKMIVKLREIPFNLQESTRLLTESVANLSRLTGEQGQGISRQAAALQETQVTVQEIKQTSLLAAQKAETVLEVAERAQEIGREGETTIEKSLVALESIREQVEHIADKITGLTERTRQIGVITETVKDLADQSNMLALNAAIEAVRSGEHGKGFAVVAREIRSLADQSIQATNRVREILEDISTATQTAVTITEKGAARMEGGLVQVRTSGENLRELSGIVKENAAAVRQIAAAVSQQNAGISQIFAAVNDLNKMMDDTVKQLDQTSKSVDVLREVTERVTAVVKSFRL
jgi:methyl-accepting chemotaxis protein